MKKPIFCFLSACMMLLFFKSDAQCPPIITSIAGTGTLGNTGDGGPATAAKVQLGYSLTPDASGNLYYSNGGGNIRKIDVNGIISTIAGIAGTGYNGDNIPATAAQLNGVNQICFDAAGNIYFAEQGNRHIRKIDLAGIIHTVVGTGVSGSAGDGGPATAALLTLPQGVIVDAAGNLYVSDIGTSRVRKVDPSGTITLFAGNGSSSYGGDGGPATAAQVNQPSCMALDAAGNLYISMAQNGAIRKVNTSGIISTVAGTGTTGTSGDGGPATAAKISFPYTIAANPAGDLFLVDYLSDRIRMVPASTGIISTIVGTTNGFAGDGGSPTAAKLNKPGAITVNSSGDLFIGDIGNERIRKVTYVGSAPSFVAGHTQSLIVCRNSSANPLTIQLEVNDPDVGQSETWSVITAPTHGSLAASYTTTSTGGIMLPFGVSYTPATGYTGSDMVKIMVQDCSGKSDTTTINITVAASLSAGVIIGPSAVCLGASITLTDASPGGVWSSSNTNISVSGGLVTGNAVGTSTVSYTVSGSCGTFVAKSTISVYPVPDPIIGTGSMCKGNTLALSDDISGGAWTSTVPSVATVDGSGNVFGVSTGTTTISYTTGGVCSQTLVVNVDPPLPFVKGPVTVCYGSTITLSDSVVGGTWSTAATVAGVNMFTGDVNGLAAGTATISYVVSSGCMITQNVTVNPLPPSIVLTNNGIITPVMCYSDKAMYATDGMSGGTWTSSLVTVDRAGFVSAYAVGSGLLTYTLLTGCSITTMITVNQSPAIVTGPKQVCTGVIDALSDAVYGGTWTTTDPPLLVDYYTGGVYGQSAGTSVVTYMLPSGCFVLDTVLVVASPSSILGVPSVCVGNVIKLSDAVTGGSWSIAPGGNGSIDPFTGAVTGLLAGGTTVTYTIGGGCTATVPFTVYSLPTAYTVSGGGDYCTGGTGVHVALSGSASGVKYYLYNGASIIDSVIGTGLPLDFGPETLAGNYSIRGGDLSTKCKAIMDDTVQVIVTPIGTPIVNITVTPGDTVCSGTSVTYVATSILGGSSPKYQWKVNGSDMGTGTLSYTYKPVNGDVIGVELTSNATCVSTPTAHGFVTMDVITPVVPDIKISVDPGINVPTGTMVTFTADIANLGLLTAPTYQWTDKGVPIPGAVHPTLSSSTLIDQHTIACFVMSGGRCSMAGADSVHMHVFDPGGHNEGVHSVGADGVNISVAPNPSRGSFVVKGDLGVSLDEEVSLELTNMLGQVVYTGKSVAQAGKLSSQVSPANTLAPGTYLLSIRSASANKVFHIVIE